MAVHIGVIRTALTPTSQPSSGWTGGVLADVAHAALVVRAMKWSTSRRPAAENGIGTHRVLHETGKARHGVRDAAFSCALRVSIRLRGSP